MNNIDFSKYSSSFVFSIIHEHSSEITPLTGENGEQRGHSIRDRQLDFLSDCNIIISDPSTFNFQNKILDRIFQNTHRGNIEGVRLGPEQIIVRNSTAHFYEFNFENMKEYIHYLSFELNGRLINTRDLMELCPDFIYQE